MAVTVIKKSLYKLVDDFDSDIKTKQPFCMAFLAHLAYHSLPYIEKYLLSHGALRVKVFSTSKGAQGFVAEFNSFACVSFRGTERKSNDIKHDLKFWKKEFLGIRSHYGFADVTESVIDTIKYDLSIIPKDKPVYYTGHSLGGAIATLLCIHKKPHCIYTFGAPMVACGHKFQQHFKNVSYFRYVTVGDVIPYLPPWFLGYTNVECKIVLDEGGPYLPWISHRSPTYLTVLEKMYQTS